MPPENARSPRKVALKEPSACSEAERQEFERLVRLGFEGSDAGLRYRIAKAKQLAFDYGTEERPVAIAALKAPDVRFREELFEQAGALEHARHAELELGWVYVEPAFRQRGLAANLCHQLLAGIPTTSVFATTRPTNAFMIRILRELGFERMGRPFPRRDHELALFLRRGPTPDTLRDGSGFG